MVSYTQLVNQPIKIQGKQVLLALDEISEDFDAAGESFSVVADATPARPEVNMFEEQIQAARKAYPRLPVYGLWHVLHHSGLLDPTTELQVLPLDERNGIFVRFDTKARRILVTGQYTDGIFQGAGDLMLEDARAIEVEVARLKLPAESAYLVKELSAIRDRAKRFRQFTAGVFIIGILVLAGITDTLLNALYTSKMDDYKEQRATLNDLQKDIDALSQRRLIYTPDNRELSNHLYQLTLLDSRILLARQTFTGNHIVAQLSKEVRQDPSVVYPWLSAKILPDGGWEVKIPFKPYQWESD